MIHITPSYVSHLGNLTIRRYIVDDTVDSIVKGQGPTIVIVDSIVKGQSLTILIGNNIVDDIVSSNSQLA